MARPFFQTFRFFGLFCGSRQVRKIGLRLYTIKPCDRPGFTLQLKVYTTVLLPRQCASRCVLCKRKGGSKVYASSLIAEGRDKCAVLRLLLFCEQHMEAHVYISMLKRIGTNAKRFQMKCGKGNLTQEPYNFVVLQGTVQTVSNCIT